MKLLARHLKRRPGVSPRSRGREAQLRELGGRREICDVEHVNRPAPQIARHRVGGPQQRDLSQYAVPLRPCGRLLVCQIRCPDARPALPPAARRRRWQQQLGDRATPSDRCEANHRESAKITSSSLPAGRHPSLLVRTPHAQRLRCQNAISPAGCAATTLRQPAGPSRGSSSTEAPSRRARSVACPMSATST